jgi:SOS-response transcriptional repressor LexA
MITGADNTFSGEVLREFRRVHNLTQMELARLLDIDRGYMARFETGNKVPSARLQTHIKQTLARYAADRATEAKFSARAGFSDHSLPPRLRNRDIPVVSWAAAGKANDYQDLAAQIDETVGSHVTDPNAFAVILEGDSMEPAFLAGDRIVVAPNLEARNGDVVLAKFRDGVVCKQFQRVGPVGGIARLKSLNENYPPLEVPIEEFAFIYPVMEFKRLVRR